MPTIVDWIAARSGGSGSFTVLDADRRPLTLPWSEVHDRARRMATVLQRRGVGSRTRVGLLADTSLELVIAIQAVWLAGAAVTVLPPPDAGRSDEAHRRQCVRIGVDARLSLIVVGGARRALAGPLAAATGIATTTLEALSADAADAEPATPVAPPPSALAILQYTSGSTRNARGVPVTHGHLAANLIAIRTATRHDTVHGCTLSWLPLYHDLGLVGSLALPMSCGCPLVLLTTASFAGRPSSWLAAVSRHRATITGAPNFAFALITRLLSAGPDLDLDLSSVRFLLAGAEPIDAAMMTRFLAGARRYGLDPSVLVPAYGLAESTLAVTFGAPGTGLRIDSVDPVVLEMKGLAVPAAAGVRARPLVRLGGPVPGTAIRIVDPDTASFVHSRQVGRIEIRGPSVVGHYWGDPPGPPDAWLDTGDLGYLADGELVVCGREKEMLIVAGRNLYPQDVEAAAADAIGIRLGRVVAFGLSGQSHERFAVAVESRTSDAATVRRAVTEAVLAEVGLTPAAVLTVPFGRLPRTSSGKLRRAEARRLHLLGALVPPERTQR